MPATKTAEITVPRIAMKDATIRIRGTTGLVCNRLANKARMELLLPAKKKSPAQRGASLKHNPVEEFRSSMTIRHGLNPHTQVFLPAPAFKAALATAALVIPGVTKSDIFRLVFLPDDLIPVYGVPRLRCDIVRQAGMNRTPDVRTRAYFPEWYSEIRLQYATPNLTATGIMTLAANAGIAVGLGDFRQEKGRGSYGCFEVFNGEIPADALDIEAQGEAIENPRATDADTEELLEWFTAEATARELL